MLDYIKQQLKARQQEIVQEAAQINTTINEPENVPDEAILEYAHIFNEMDELSVEGTDADRDRKLAVEIPLDDDMEVETVEFDLNDGRITDVPGDATVTEYETMKTRDKFVQEAMNMVRRLPRESDKSYFAKVNTKVDELYAEYCKDAEEIGAFGFTKIPITSEKVPSKMTIDFGSMSTNDTRSFVSKLDTVFAVDSENQITKKQLDSVKLAASEGFKNIGSQIQVCMESMHGKLNNIDSIWDVVTPNRIVVPKGNGDSFCVVLEYTDDINNSTHYIGWTRNVSHDESEEHSMIQESVRINMESFVNETNYLNKMAFIQEMEVVEKRNRQERRGIPSRFNPNYGYFQEAIDFGNDADNDNDNAGDGGSDLPPATDDNNGDESSDAATSDDSNTDTSATSEDSDVNTDSGSDAAATDENNSDDKPETAVVNDVSADIAEKVANQTQSDADDGSSDNAPTFDEDSDDTSDDSSSSIDDTTGDTDSADEGDSTDDSDNGESIDDQLNDLDVENSEADADIDEESDDIDSAVGSDPEMMGNIDNMTIDQLIEHGSEKLKSMPLGKIKQFLQSGSPEAVQESFIITKNNVNKEIDVNIRKCLGVLNDNSMNVDKIFIKFKNVGHKLNRVLSKAVRIKGAFSSDEVKAIQTLNSKLTELLTSLKIKKTNEYASAIKNKIAAFTKECENVASIVEEKLHMNSTTKI